MPGRMSSTLRKRYPLRRGKRRGMRPIRKVMRNRLTNYYRFKRFGENTMIACGSTAAGTVFLDGPAGFAIGPPSGDYNGTYQFGGAMQFQLDQTLEWKDFSNLFDKYRIKGVKVTIIPLGQPSTNAAPAVIANTNYPTIAIAVDNDDASLPSTWESVAVKQDCKIKRLSKPVSVYIRNPKLASAVYNGLTTAYSPQTGWVDTVDSDVPHYGLKFFMRECPLPIATNPGNGANVLFRIVTKYYLEMKDPQ